MLIEVGHPWNWLVTIPYLNAVHIHLLMWILATVSMGHSVLLDTKLIHLILLDIKHVVTIDMLIYVTALG